MGTAAVAIALRKAERHVLDRLRAAGATAPERAAELPELRMLEARRLERLKDAGAIVEEAPGRYWVNEAAYLELRSERRHIVWPILALAVALALWMTLRGAR